MFIRIGFDASYMYYVLCFLDNNKWISPCIFRKSLNRIGHCNRALAEVSHSWFRTSGKYLIPCFETKSVIKENTIFIVFESIN